MRELQLWAGQESVEQAFDEIAEAAAGCRFRDCTHTVEAGCAVRSGMEAGEVSETRWRSYSKLMAEARHHEAMTDRMAALEQKRRWKVTHKAARRFKKE